ncbi:flagellar hook-associated protein FlgK [Entomospira culicis]|uniref:Flagellar hook-associated protein 1 n=1 Tax=Entomospira culicis TaxID=2719989 RepID=A0A968GGN3_9SPIO|nr:flagellar hook-associated protein FlgK [Entomospira culicis]NIZ18486.1 flagellar hook-associated protein FlgK [Entomospira culicis]NIZ68702.1 flagellar hook-associated protein FlgK [Entomospira culicis]WDI37301.1 flagellar hook-associated protein FlgK [Entomospira culicis]WDI38930.1 flagellar hook-associated protein FlgK [Entomospira culicis]
MHSTFMGLEMGKRGMFAHQTALQTTGHNITNLNTEGYSRQRVRIGTIDPLYDPGLARVHVPGQLGQGPTTTRIERVFDVLHENQVISASDDLGYWRTRDFYVDKLEKIYNEPNDVSVRTFMDHFWNSWQDVAENPESLAARVQVVQNGKALSESINHRHAMLQEQRLLLNDDIKFTVTEINQKTEAIAKLNVQIARVQAIGDEPNDLLDKRDQMIRELAVLVPVSVDHQDADEFRVHIGGRILVQGELVNPLSAEADPNNDGLAMVRWGDINPPHNRDSYHDTYRVAGGKLGALIELRDVDVKDELRKLDAMTVHFIDLVNDVHAQGAGMNGNSGLDFFRQNNYIENATGSIDTTGDGQLDSTYLFRISGANQLKATQQVGLAGEITLSAGNGDLVTIAYNPNDTVGDIINRINYSGADVVARLDVNGNLSLKGSLSYGDNTPDFVIRHVEDSGQFLVGYAGLLNASGADGAYDYQNPNAAEEQLRVTQGVSFQTTPLQRPSAWIAVNAQIASDANNVAAAKPLAGSGEVAIGNNASALAIADLRHEKVMIDRLTSFDDFFADSVALIGAKGFEAQETHAAFSTINKNLDDIRQSISGVNINEEFADLVRFQHGFTASARFVNVVDQMLDTIINRLKV